MVFGILGDAGMALNHLLSLVLLVAIAILIADDILVINDVIAYLRAGIGSKMNAQLSTRFGMSIGCISKI